MKNRSKKFQKIIETQTESKMQDSDIDYAEKIMESPKFYEND